MKNFLIETKQNTLNPHFINPNSPNPNNNNN